MLFPSPQRWERGNECRPVWGSARKESERHDRYGLHTRGFESAQDRATNARVRLGRERALQQKKERPTAKGGGRVTG